MPCPDIKINPEFVLTTIDQAWYQAVRNHGVVHINCMFRQPLTLVKTSEDLKTYIKPLNRGLNLKALIRIMSQVLNLLLCLFLRKLPRVLNAIKNGVIVVGKIGGA